MEDSSDDLSVYQFKFKKRLCVFCALQLDLQDEEVDNNCRSLNEETFVKGISVLCEALNVKENLDELDTWRLIGIDNFVRYVCCENCYILINELVSLHQLILKYQASLKENTRKLETFVVNSQSPSLEYSVNACVLLRQEILNKHETQNEAPSQLKRKRELPRKSKSFPCRNQPIVLLKRLEVFPPQIKQDLDSSPIKTTCDIEDEEIIYPSSSLPDVKEPEEDSAKDEEEDDQEYRPIKRSRRSTGRKRGRPRNTKPPKTPGKPGRPRKINQSSSPPLSSNVVTKRRRKLKPAFHLIEEETQSQQNIDGSCEKPTIPSTKGGRPLVIGSRHYRFLHEGSGPKLHAIYFLSTYPSPSPSETQMKTYLMVYNVKFCKTSTYLRCLHPQCNHEEPLTGYFTDQIILRNMRFHIRFAHRSPPKKDKPEEEKPHFYYCHTCEKQMDSKVDLLEHRRQLHPEADPLPSLCFCDVCGDPSVAPGDLVQHVFSHKSEKEKDMLLEESNKKGIGKDKDILRPMVHPCDQCDKYFKCHTELMTHRICHLPKELKAKVICDICGRGCRSASLMEIHKRRVHFRDLPIEYECHVCGKGFIKGMKDRWIEHLNMHTGEKPFQCEQCGKAFLAKKYLTRHVKLLHEGEKDKVSCEFCGKIYKDERYLRKHSLKNHRDKVKIMRVLGEDKDKYKPLEQRPDFIGPKLMFPCEPCGKVFIFKSMLITHLKNRHKMFYERNEDYPWQLTLE